MQNDRLRDFLKFFRFHLSWFILSAGFFAVILISAIFLSTKYVVDTATTQNSPIISSSTPESLEVVTPQAPLAPIEPASPVAPTSSLAPVQPTPSLTPVKPTPTPTVRPTPQPTATPTPVVSDEPSQPKTYSVQQGDTLWNIAEQNYQDGQLFSRISQENNLTNPNIIRVGQTLTLPTLDNQTEASQKGSISDSAWSDDKTVYVNSTIVTGDSLWKIAERELGDPYRWMEIYQANETVIGADPDLIYPNVTLRIPTDTETVSVSPYSFNWTSSLLQ